MVVGGKREQGRGRKEQKLGILFIFSCGFFIEDEERRLLEFSSVCVAEYYQQK